MTWTKVLYSKSQIKKAGQILRNKNSLEEELLEATEILNNWRAAHSYPLHIFQMTLKNISKKNDKTSLIAQRLKRTSSIIRKLNRIYNNNKASMELTQMQDIGGCRVIFRNLKIARSVYENYYLKGNLKHKIIGNKDYITNPKSDGYRGFHIIYEYKTDKEGKKEYNGLRIEVQIRTKLQHQWATAIETVDVITKQAIKFNEGKADWKEFFKLVSSAFAIKEACLELEEEKKKELYAQIKEKEKELSVIKKLTGWTNAINHFNKTAKKEVKGKAKFFLLELDIDGEQLLVRPFSNKQENEAITEYSKLEKKYKNNSNYDIVLVGVETTKDLEKAYPNYFADTKEFIAELNEIISKTKK